MDLYILQLKKHLISHYDRVKSEIDIDAQTALLEMTDETMRKELLDVNLKMINECELRFNKNMADMNAEFAKIKAS